MQGRKRPASGGGLRQRPPPDGILRRPAPDDILPQSPFHLWPLPAPPGDIQRRQPRMASCRRALSRPRTACCGSSVPPPCFGRHSAAAARPGRHPAAGPPPSGPVRPERGQTCAQELRPLRRWAEKTRESSFAALFRKPYGPISEANNGIAKNNKKILKFSLLIFSQL